MVVEPRPGFGAACFAGLSAARAEVVCFMDCDASFDPRELPRVAEPVAAADADLVLGARAPARLAPRRGSRTARWRSSCGAGAASRLTDLGPMRAARREALLALGLRDRRFGWPLEMVVRAAAAGWEIREVPVRHLPRRGRSKVTGTVRGTLRAVRDMAAVLG